MRSERGNIILIAMGAALLIGFISFNNQLFEAGVNKNVIRRAQRQSAFTTNEIFAWESHFSGATTTQFSNDYSYGIPIPPPASHPLGYPFDVRTTVTLDTTKTVLDNFTGANVRSIASTASTCSVEQMGTKNHKMCLHASTPTSIPPYIQKCGQDTYFEGALDTESTNCNICGDPIAATDFEFFKQWMHWTPLTDVPVTNESFFDTTPQTKMRYVLQNDIHITRPHNWSLPTGAILDGQGKFSIIEDSPTYPLLQGLGASVVQNLGLVKGQTVGPLFNVLTEWWACVMNVNSSGGRLLYFQDMSKNTLYMIHSGIGAAATNNGATLARNGGCHI